MRKVWILNLMALAAIMLFSTSIPVNAESYADETAHLIKEYPMEEKSMKINMDTGEILLNGVPSSLKEELGVSGTKEKAILDSAYRLDDTMESNGYEKESVDGRIITYESRFQTKRLIISGYGVKNDYGAVDTVYRERDYTILQYDTPESAAKAYFNLLDDGYDVTVDEVIENAMCYFDGRNKCVDDGAGIMRLDYMQNNRKYQTNPVVVAVLDTGINASLLGNRIAGQKDFSGNSEITDSHGTEVGGIIADGTGNNVKLLSLKVFNEYGKATTLGIDSAICYAVENGADIINMSLGLSQDTPAVNVKIWNQSIDKAIQNRIPVIVASGNEGTSTDYCYPACYEPCWTVGSVGDNKQWSSFSNYGSVDFVAPGDDIVTVNGRIKTGTSYSVPYITAFAANLQGYKSYGSVQKEYEEIQSLCEDLGTEGFNEYYGYGLPIYQGETCNNHQWVLFTSTKQSCESDETENYRCSICGMSKLTVLKKATGHRYQQTDSEPATCVDDGYIEYECSVCGDISVDWLPVDANNHVNTKTTVTDSDCIHEGTKTVYCYDCEKTVSKTVIPAKEHSFSITKKEATHTENGYIHGICNICGYKYETIIPVIKDTKTSVTTENQVPAALKKSAETSSTKGSKTTENITGSAGTAEIQKVTEDTRAAKAKKVKLSKVQNISSRKIRVKLKKITGYQYQIKISTSKKFTKSVKTYNTSKNTYTIKKLKKGRTYYVKARTRKKVGSGIVYGKWSTVKKIKIKR